MHDDWSTSFAQHHSHHQYESATAAAADLLPLLIFESNNTNNNGTHIGSSHVSISANALFVVMSYFISILGAFTAFQLVNEMRYVKSKIKRFIFIVCASISMSICAIWSMHFVGTVCFNHHNMGEHLEITYDVTLTVMSAVVPFFACLFGFLCTTIQLFIPKFRLVTLFPLSLCFPDYVSKTQDSITSTQDETMTDVLGENVGKKKKRNFISKLRRFAVHSVLGNEFRPHIIQILIGALFAATGICGMHYMGMLATQVDGTIRTWNGGIIFASVVIAYLASCAADRKSVV